MHKKYKKKLTIKCHLVVKVVDRDPREDDVACLQCLPEKNPLINIEIKCIKQNSYL